MMNLDSKIQTSFQDNKGFTLIELLVVISVIGLLATLTFSSLRDAGVRARYAAAQGEMRAISQAIIVAQGEAQSNLNGITGSFCSACSCFGPLLRDIPDTHQCAIDQAQVLGDIKTANRGLIKLPDSFRDPWGSPYLFDENEGEAVYGFCADDNIISVGPDGIIDYISGNSDDYRITVPNFSPACR